MKGAERAAEADRAEKRADDLLWRQRCGVIDEQIEDREPGHGISWARVATRFSGD